MSKKGKGVPAAATARDDSKHVRTQEVPKVNNPSWRFSTVDITGPFAWPKDDAIKLGILQKLHSFDSMTWGEIEGHDHHAIPLEKLSKKANEQLQLIKQDDIDEIFSFHFSGKQRIIGIRDRGIVRLLWWDPKHEVCPSVKKHT